MPHDQQTAVLAGVLDVVKRLVELGDVNICDLPDFGGLRDCAPAAFGIGRRIFGTDLRDGEAGDHKFEQKRIVQHAPSSYSKIVSGLR